MDITNDEQDQLEKKIREFTSNTRPKSLNMKKEKESVQNSVLAILKGT